MSLKFYFHDNFALIQYAILNIQHQFHKYKNNYIVKFGYSEKAAKFEKIFNLKFDVTE